MAKGKARNEQAYSKAKTKRSTPKRNYGEQNEYNKKDKAHSDEVDKYLINSKFWNKIGAFEGAGYSAKGMYRSMLDCLMFSKVTKPFCKVCEEHVKKVINHLLNDKK